MLNECLNLIGDGAFVREISEDKFKQEYLLDIRSESENRFETWWKEEALYSLVSIDYNNIELIKIIAKQAWFNGAYVEKELSNEKRRFNKR